MGTFKLKKLKIAQLIHWLDDNDCYGLHVKESFLVSGWSLSCWSMWTMWVFWDQIDDFMDNVRVCGFFPKELTESLEVMELGNERFGCTVI